MLKIKWPNASLSSSSIICATIWKRPSVDEDNSSRFENVGSASNGLSSSSNNHAFHSLLFDSGGSAPLFIAVKIANKV